MKKIARVLCLLVALSLFIGTFAIAEINTVDEHAKYDEPVVIKVIGNLSDQVRKNTLKDDYTIENNPWTDAYLEVLNVKREYMWVTSSDDEYSMKRNLALAVGDIPDFLQVSGVELQKLAEAGVIIDNIRELYDAEGSERLKEIISLKGEIAWECGVIDGVEYGIPINGGIDNDARGFAWIRKDWLDNLNLSVPTNYEEFIAVVEAFVTDDPDQNNADDTFGIAFCNSLDATCLTMRYFLNMYHSDYGYWVEKDGKLVNTDVLPETKEALSALREMYTKGWIDPEFGVKDMNAVAMDITNNKVGIVFGANWSPLSNVLNDCIQANANADFICVPTNTLSVDGEYALTGQDARSTNFLVISKSCEHPEAVIRMLNLFRDLYDESYDTYGITADGREMWHLASVPTWERPTKNMDNMIYGGKYLTGELTAEEITGEQYQMAQNVDAFHKGDRTMWSWARIFACDGPYLSSEWHVVDAYKEFDKFSFYDAYLGNATQGMVDYQSMINTIRNEKYIKIIIGDESMDSFDDYVAEWYDAGGQIITDEVNEWYASR